MSLDRGCKSPMRFKHRKPASVDVQDRVLDLYFDEGLNTHAIAERLGMNFPVVETILKRGTVVPDLVPMYRCPECGCKIECRPCLMCRAKLDAKRGRVEMGVLEAAIARAEAS